MRKTTLDVADLFSTLDFAGVQKRLLALPGVGAVEMTAASFSVTVIYDPDRTDAATLAAEIKACGFHCRGESVPKHLCLPDSAAVPPDHPSAPSAAVPKKDPHAGHGGMSLTAKMARNTPAGAAKDPHAGHAGITPAAMEVMNTAPAKGARDAMAHEMGHGSGMDMQAMVSDMRNRFFVALVFTLPIFALTPMGIGAPLFAPPSASALM